MARERHKNLLQCQPAVDMLCAHESDRVAPAPPCRAAAMSGKSESWPAQGRVAARAPRLSGASSRTPRSGGLQAAALPESVRAGSAAGAPQGCAPAGALRRSRPGTPDRQPPGRPDKARQQGRIARRPLRRPGARARPRARRAAPQRRTRARPPPPQHPWAGGREGHQARQCMFRHALPATCSTEAAAGSNCPCWGLQNTYCSAAAVRHCLWEMVVGRTGGHHGQEHVEGGAVSKRFCDIHAGRTAAAGAGRPPRRRRRRARRARQPACAASARRARPPRPCPPPRPPAAPAACAARRRACTGGAPRMRPGARSAPPRLPGPASACIACYSRGKAMQAGRTGARRPAQRGRRPRRPPRAQRGRPLPRRPHARPPAGAVPTRPRGACALRAPARPISDLLWRQGARKEPTSRSHQLRHHWVWHLAQQASR